MTHIAGMDIVAPEYDDLMKRYLDVCNRALARNKNRFPFKQILGAAQKSECGRMIEVNVIDPRLRAARASYVMKIEGNRIVASPHGNCPDCNCARAWNVREDYLRNVSAMPNTYIKNPAKLDWEWMYDVPAR